MTSVYAMVVHVRPKTPKNRSFGGHPAPTGRTAPIISGTQLDRICNMCPSLIQMGSKTAEKTLHKQTDKQTDRQTDRQTNRHYENNGHLAVNQ